MTPRPLSLAEFDNLRAVVRAEWPKHAQAQGVGTELWGDMYTGPGPFTGKLYLSGAGPVSDAADRALEGVARILEDAGYAVERRGTARIVTGWATIGGRRIADMPPSDRVRDMYDTGLSLGRKVRDRARLEAIGGNAKREHAVMVNEMARRSKV